MSIGARKRGDIYGRSVKIKPSLTLTVHFVCLLLLQRTYLQLNSLKEYGSTRHISGLSIGDYCYSRALMKSVPSRL